MFLYLGSSNGLRMVLNIEEYEYMRGPQDDAGVKVCTSKYSEVNVFLSAGSANQYFIHIVHAIVLPSILDAGILIVVHCCLGNS